MRSMTGYGSGRAALGHGHVVLDVRAVNHRFLDVRVRLPSRIQTKAPIIERVVRQLLERGRVDVAARFEGQTLPPATLDLDRARAVYRDLERLRDELSPGEPLPLSVIASVPDLFVASRELDEDTLEEALAIATTDACRATLVMRKKEGQALANELTSRLAELKEQLQAIENALPGLVDMRRTRIRERLGALLADTSVTLDSGRLEQEIAILADRSDVTEELVRLGSHCGQMLDLIENSDAPVGKRIDFLLQEMSREANTIGSKQQEQTITPHVVALKACIEQMREQAQNVL